MLQLILFTKSADEPDYGVHYNILESHLSYPVLGYYRSQHNQQSWVEALTVILDTCALILAGIEDVPVEPARFAFAISRHAVVDLAQVFDLTFTPGVDRLPTSEFVRVQEVLAASGILLKRGMDAEGTLADLRETYEPFVTALARYMQVSLPPWVADKDALDDWQTNAWDEGMPAAHRTLPKTCTWSLLVATFNRRGSNYVMLTEVLILLSIRRFRHRLSPSLHDATKDGHGR